LILVLVGTNPYSFDRLVSAIDQYALQAGEEVFIQLGHTSYVPRHAKHECFLEKEEISRKILEAELVVTQGGFGSIADCLRAKKRVVAVPRKPELNESPDCQEELVRELERLGLVTGVYDIDNLHDAIIFARKIDLMEKNNSIIPNIIQKFIQGTI